MTTQEIKDLVSAKIAGQGTQVDAGNALAEVLNAIVDAIPEGGGASCANLIEVTSITVMDTCVVSGTFSLEDVTPNTIFYSGQEFVQVIFAAANASGYEGRIIGVGYSTTEGAFLNREVILENS